LHFGELNLHDTYYQLSIATANMRHCAIFIIILESLTMLSMPLRKQGGAAVITIPPSVLKSMHLSVGMQIDMDLRDGALVLQPSSPKRKRYTIAQLLEGATPKLAKALVDDTAWAREGSPVGRELA
jgi:antitoxin ChpS